MDGSVVEKRFFDAWGNLKGIVNAAGQMITDPTAISNYTLFLDRGYTGHEHLWKAGLINMNARLYDPILRKFLSPDNLVPDPFNTQSYDRFGYVYNNPLLYVDIDGNEPITFGVAVIIGVAVAITTKAVLNMINGIPLWYGMGKAAVMGAVSGAISFGVGAAATSTFGQTLTVGKALFEAGAHALTSGTMSAIDGEFGGSAFLSGAVSSLMASGVQGLGGIKGADGISFGQRKSDLLKAIMITTGGLSGGISSTITGGNFWDGFRQGIITSGLNHVAHLAAGSGGIKVYDDEGDYVGKIKIKTYRDANYDDGSRGLVIEMSFTAVGNKYDSFNWIQTVPELKILVFSVYDNDVGLQYIMEGAEGYLNKLSEEEKIIEAVESIFQTGKYYSIDIVNRLVSSMQNKSPLNPIDVLSEREKEIFDLFLEGYGNLEVSNTLNLHLSTVSTYKTRIFKKLNIKTIADLIRIGDKNQKPKDFEI